MGDIFQIYLGGYTIDDTILNMGKKIKAVFVIGSDAHRLHNVNTLQYLEPLKEYLGI